MTTQRELHAEDGMPEGEIPTGRPVVRNGADLNRVVDESWAALMECNDPREPRVMQYAGTLVRLNRTSGMLEKYDRTSLRHRLSEVATFITGDERRMKVPTDIAGLILSRDLHDDAPVIESVAHMPFLGRDLKLHTEPGYHEAERIWLAPEVDLPPVDPNPHLDDVNRHVEFLLDEWLGDFAFADQASRANALALAILPFVRPAIAEATPMHICHAPEPGAGKSTLAKVAVMPGCGNTSMVELSRWGSELEYKVTAWLTAGRPVIWFDNQVSGFTVDSGLLSALITEPSYSGRIVGTSTAPDLPIRCVWLMTGNNLDFTEELARRGVLIQFNPGLTRPSERRNFKHSPLPAWTMEHRKVIAYSLLTLVQHWAAGVVKAGTYDRIAEVRERAEQMKGSFEEWSDIVGGILYAANVKGFLSNESDMKSLAVADLEASSFLAALFESTGGEPFLSAEISGSIAAARKSDAPPELVRACKPMIDTLPDELAGTRVDLPVALRTWLRGRNGSWKGRYRVKSVGKRTPVQWIVEEKV